MDTALSSFVTRAIPLVEATNYVLEIDNEFGCRSEVSENFIVTSIAELQKTSVQLSYNNASEQWEWRSNKPFTIIVWTIDGKLLLNERNVSETSLKAGGVVIVSIEQEGIQQRYKMVK